MPVAVVGGGSIGVSWSIVMARAGHRVKIYDSDPHRHDTAISELHGKLEALARERLLDEAPALVADRVGVVSEMREAVWDAGHVQECVTENLTVKREVLDHAAQHAPADCILASSSSALTASAICGERPWRARALVAHPANPPHLLPVVELVPGPFTAPEVVERTEQLMLGAGMSPVRVMMEVAGFVFNRLQGAVLREAYALVRDGVIDVEGVDRVMREGLGRRWSVVGPFETADLNTRGGIAVHAERMGPAYARMGTERTPGEVWSPALIASVADQRRRLLPLDQWEERVEWRDEQLIKQEQARRTAAR